jgi:iron(III) transport system ATP-binding protein
MHLVIDQLQVTYPGQTQPAVAQVSLSLTQGQLGVLIGPSGCGKTTLLRAIAGLEKVSGGEIRMQGRSLSSTQAQVPPEQRRMGMVFQDYALFPHLSVADNIAFGLFDQPPAKRRERVQAMLDLVGLNAVADGHPHQLSGGQQQRVALARALAPEPELLLLDEPFSNLDIELRERLAHELRDILQQAGITALFVTHDQMEAFALGDRVGVMHQGRLWQWDSPYQVYHRPANRWVAGFIGHGVFASAQWQDTPEGSRTLQTPLGPLSETMDVNTRSSTPLTEENCEVLLRADDVVHDDDAPVKAEILRKVFRGAEFLYTLRLANGQELLAHVPSHHDHQVGEWIGIRLQADHVVVFPTP